jgi:uncharacterized protein (DUF736 family)
MAYEVKPNTGSLFKNERKEAETHADYRGSGLIDGVEYWFDAWINTSKDGQKYMSLKFKPKNADQSGSYARQEPARSPRPASAFDDDTDTGIPF